MEQFYQFITNTQPLITLNAEEIIQEREKSELELKKAKNICEAKL
jgi:hypothetical protein